MAGVRELLAPDGTFVFETGYFPDLARKLVIDNIYHEHLSYYSVKPLSMFFHRFGMKLVAIDHEPTKGGSIRGFVKFDKAEDGRDAGDRDRLLRDEMSDGFDGPKKLGWFTAKSEQLRQEVIGMVADRRRKGRTVVGYGASVGVTTLLYYFDLGDALPFLVDDNPIRHGRFTPGHHIPVLPSDALYEKKPDDVLLLAWRYAGPITKRHQKFAGELLLPQVWKQ
jgi:hypothetical protein